MVNVGTGAERKYTQVRASLENAQRIRDLQIKLVAHLNEFPNQDRVIGLALDALEDRLGEGVGVAAAVK